MKTNNTLAQHIKEQIKEQTEAVPGQYEAITSDSPLVVVSAGAGTGKTWTLAWRFIWALISGRAATNEILTLTFTEKAALEMAERIKNMLFQLGMKHPSYRSLFQDAADRIDEGYISTIHAFSMRVLKECGLATHLDPESGVVAPPQESIFWKEAEEALDQWNKEWFQRGLPSLWTERVRTLFTDPLFMNIINAFGPEAVTTHARQSLALFASQGYGPEDIWQWSNVLPDRDQSTLEQAQTSLYQKWEKEWLRFLEPDIGIFYNLKELKGKSQLSNRIQSLMKQWGERPSLHDMPLFVLSLIDTLKGARGKLSDEIAESLGEAVSPYRNRLKKDEPWLSAFHSGFDSDEQLSRICMLRIAAVFWQIWNEFRIRKNRLSFDDMISYAIEALEQSPSYAGRFKEILVDEFQDTNPLQDRLIQAVRRYNQRLFLVGDVKQSIYRFRHADLSLFASYIRKAKSGEGEYIALNKSFRSRENLVSEVNNLFASIWKDGLGQNLQLPFEPLDVPRNLDTYKTRQQCTVDPLVIYLEEGKEKEKVGDMRLRQIRRLASLFSRYHNDKHTIWDKKQECLRPVQWEDMAILVPSRTTWFPLLEKIFFEEFQIPIYFEGSTRYFSRSEIQDIIELLNLLDDPENENYLISFLSSPFSTLSLDDVQELVKTTTKGYRYKTFQQQWPHLAQQIQEWRLMAHFLGPSSVLASFLGRGNETLLSFPAWKRRSVAANIRKAIDIAREFEETIGISLPGCARYLRDAVEKQEKITEAEVSGEHEDVIRVMTVHGAKGLEFPVLAVMGLERSSSDGEKKGLMPSKQMGVALRHFPDEKSSNPPLAWSLSKLLDEQEEYEEWQRLFYVASTRARDSLVLCSLLPQNKDGYSISEKSWLNMLLTWKPGLPLCNDEPPSVINVKLQKETTENIASFVPLPQPEPQFLSKISATSFALFQYCPYAFRLKHRQGQELVWEQPSDDPTEGGTNVGSLVHILLSRWDFISVPLDSFFPQKNWLEFAETLPSELRPVWKRTHTREDVYSWLFSFQESSLVKQIRENRTTIRKEFPFRVSLPEGPTMGGSIDLLWREKDTLFIRDYKITTLAHVPENLYKDQLAFYALAMKKALHISQISLGLWHLREGIEEPVHVSNKDWTALEERVRKTAHLAISGPFKPIEGRCSLCPFKRECTWPLK